MSEDPSTNPSTIPRTSVTVIKQCVNGDVISPPEDDLLAIEDPLEIVLHYDSKNGSRVNKALTLMMRTPGNDVELITGFLFTERIIEAAEDIVEIRFNEPAAAESPTHAEVELRSGMSFSTDSLDRNFTVNSSCGVCGKTTLEHLALPISLKMGDSTLVEAEMIHRLPRQMTARQDVFHKTGGLHASAMFSADGELIVSREDIGRHNALDKVIGAMLAKAESGQLLCVSGRMSYEILQKALVARIGIIVGVGAPSSLAVTMANDYDVTLIGFARNNRFNIYSCPQRIRTA